MKFHYLLLLSLTLLPAEQVEISADSFEADEKKMFSILTGNVVLKKGADEVHANSLTILFDKKNRPKEYLAVGDITFTINTDKQSFDGHAKKLRYDPSILKYEISGSAYIHEKTNNSKLYGETIMIDRISGKSTIKGSKKRPVKFIFQVKEQ